MASTRPESKVSRVIESTDAGARTMPMYVPQMNGRMENAKSHQYHISCTLGYAQTLSPAGVVAATVNDIPRTMENVVISWMGKGVERDERQVDSHYLAQPLTGKVGKGSE